MEQIIDTKIKKGVLEYIVLLIISSGDVYASDIINILNEASLITVEGTVYPLLSKLTRERKVEYRWEESPNGPPRKYYTLSQYGHEFLKAYKKAWDSMIQNISYIQTNYVKGS